MDNRLLIGFLVFLGAFLVLPIALQQLRGGPDADRQTGGGGTTATPQRRVSDIPELNQPPLLNEGNLINSEWQVTVEQYKIKVTLAAGGICYATHPLAKAITGMEYLEGRWRVDYDKLHVSTAFGGQEHNVVLKISGNNVYYVEGSDYSLVHRFN